MHIHLGVERPREKERAIQTDNGTPQPKITSCLACPGNVHLRPVRCGDPQMQVRKVPGWGGWQAMRKHLDLLPEPIGSQQSQLLCIKIPRSDVHLWKATHQQDGRWSCIRI